MEKEIRIIPSEISEFRATGKSRKIEGYGIVFNSESKDLGGFVEIITPEAINGVIERSDVLALLNHNQERGLLARSTNGKGTLNLDADKKGLRYAFTAPKTALGDEVVEGIERGDIRTSSFAFSVPAEGWGRWTKTEDGRALRIINQFDKIFDISPVYREAYEDTTVALRSLEELKQKEFFAEQEVEQRTEEPEAVADVEIEDTKPDVEEPTPEPIVDEVRTEEQQKEPKKEVKTESINNLNYNEMNVLELRNAKTEAYEENKKLFDLAKTEGRSLTTDEEQVIKSNVQKMEELRLQIETEEKMAGSGRFVGPFIKTSSEKFSLLKAILAKAEMREMPTAASRVFEIGKEEMRKSQIGYSGDIVIPTYLPKEFRAGDILALGAGKGAEIVATDKTSIIPPLLSKLIFRTVGVTWMDGLNGNVSMPNYTGTAVGWKAEVAAADDGSGDFSDIDLTPKRLTGYIDVSRQFLLQDGVGAEQLLLSNIADAVARKLESTILGVAIGSSTQPQGIGYKVTTGTDTKLAGAVPTQAILVAMETAVDASNALQENLAYITNATGRGILKSHLRTATYGEEYLCENNIVNGYPLLVTNSCSNAAGTDSKSLIVFGNWKDLVIGQWGGFDLTVDPYTLAPEAQVRITINAFFDARGLRGSASTDVHADGTQDDHYAVSFATRAIKIS